MTQIKDLLRMAIPKLSQAGCDTPRLDAEVLLAFALKQDRAWLYAHLTDPIPPQIRAKFNHYLARRIQREPVAYLIENREFYGLNFKVTPKVLIPRPETEALIVLAIESIQEQPQSQPKNDTKTILDIGTGSGCIAISLAVHSATSQIIATDISPEALSVAHQNAICHQVSDRIQFIQTDIMEGVAGPFDLIVSNPPYIAKEEMNGLSPEILSYEPHLALTDFGNGLALIEKILRSAAPQLKTTGHLLIEIGSSQGPAALVLANQIFPKKDISIKPDLAGRDRILFIGPNL